MVICQRSRYYHFYTYIHIRNTYDFSKWNEYYCTNQKFHMPFHMHTTCTRVWMTYNVNPLSDHVTFKQQSSYTYIFFWLLYFVVSLYVLIRTYIPLLEFFHLSNKGLNVDHCFWAQQQAYFEQPTVLNGSFTRRLFY